MIFQQGNIYAYHWSRLEVRYRRQSKLTTNITKPTFVG